MFDIFPPAPWEGDFDTPNISAFNDRIIRSYFSLGYCRFVKTCIFTFIALVPLSLVDGADPIKASSVKVEGIILEKITPACQPRNPQPRIAASSSKHAVSFR